MRLPNVPESIDGWSILHRVFRFDRRRWDALDATHRTRVAAEAIELLGPLHDDPETDVALVQLLGHKGDLMLTHYAKSFDGLGDVQIAFDKLALRDYLEPASSYVSDSRLPASTRRRPRFTPSSASAASSRIPRNGTPSSTFSCSEPPPSRAPLHEFGRAYPLAGSPASTRWTSAGAKT